MDIWGLAYPGWAAPPRAGQFLEIVNNSTVSTLSNANQPIQSPTPSNLFYQVSSSMPLSTCPDHLRARSQTTRDSPCAPEPTEISQTSQSKACLPCLAHSFHGNHDKCSSPHFLLFFCLLTDPSASPCAPCGLACPVLLGIVSITNYLSMAVVS